MQDCEMESILAEALYNKRLPYSITVQYVQYLRKNLVRLAIKSDIDRPARHENTVRQAKFNIRLVRCRGVLESLSLHKNS